MNSIQRLFICILILALFIPFQNCQRNGLNPFTTNSVQKIQNSLSGGNGGGYDGKPDIPFYRFVPNFDCGNQSTHFYSQLTIGDSGVSFLDQSSCQSQSMAINYNDLQFSHYDANLVGYKNNIFIYASTSIEPDQNTYVEAWCSDNSEKQSEIIFKYNAVQKQATGIFYQNGKAAESLGILNRVISNTQTLFKNDQIELTILKNQKDQNDLYVTTLQKIGNSSENIQLSCRLGGYLDSALWPAKNRGNGFEILFTSDKNKAYQIQGDSNDLLQARQLVELDLKSSERVDLTSKTFGHAGVKKIQLSKDEKYLLYLSDRVDQPYVFNLYSLSLKDHVVTQLSQNLVKLEQSVFDYGISADSRWVYFSDASYFDLLTNSYQLNLKLAAIDGKTPLSLISENSSTFVPGQRIILPNFSQSFLNMNDDNSDSQSRYIYYLQTSATLMLSYNLWRYDLISKEKKMLLSSTPNQMIIISSLLFKPAGRDEIFITVYNQKYEPQVVVVGSTSLQNANPGLSLMSASYNQQTQQWIMLNEFDSFKQVGSFSVYTEDFTLIDKISFRHSLYFDHSLQGLYYIDLNEKLNLYQLAFRQSNVLCPSIDAVKNLALTESGDVYLIRSVEKETQVLRFDQQKRCNIVNSLPLVFNLDGQLSVSPGLDSLVLNVGSFLSTQPSEALLWIPFSGMSSVRIDTSDTTANWWKAFFNQSSTKIFYFGTDKNSTQSILFEWSLPK